MRPASSPNRREFLKTATGAAVVAMTATSYGRVVGANDRISIGVIGCGRRGRGAHMPGVHAHAEAENVQITAVCDVWQRHLQQAAAKTEEWYGRPARQFTCYRELLAQDDVDAVMIASCDHQHCTHLEAAAEAKKDAYCEKPLAMTLEELKSACDAVEASGIVVQIGTQSRSYPGMVGVKKLYETGALGKISRVEQMRNGNKPYWYKRLEPGVKESDVDWKEFLTNRPQRPYNDRKFTGWYGYRDFSSGTIGGYMSHFIDLVHFITGAQFPASAVAHGGTFTWIDENHFDCPDHVETALVYPEGFMVSYMTNFGNSNGSRTAMYGSRGVIDFSNRQKPFASGAGGYEKGPLGEEVPVEPVECADHFLNWLQCLRSRNSPVAPIGAGYQHGVAVILSDLAYATGQRQIYDHQKREIRAG